MKTHGRIILLAGLLAMLPGLFARPAFADWSGGDPTMEGVTPQYRDDLPSDAECTTLGYDYGFKIEAPPDGTYPFTEAYGDLQPPGTLDDPANSVTILDGDGQSFNWLATLGIDAVVVKGGDGANLYVYDPEATSDSGLHAPMSGTGQADPGVIRDISHITFCFDYSLPRVGSIKIEKASHSEILEGAFEFQSTIAPTTFDLEIGQSLTFADLPAGGPYVFSEKVPEGILLTSVECKDAVESTVVIGELGGFDAGDTSVSITLAAGEDIVCTFTDDPVVPPPTGAGFSPALLLSGLAIVGVALLTIGGLLRVRAAGLR